jgi:formylglycine-generating enzyme required for sulfatase activity
VRLPSEAEWEYAARAGTATRYWWGDEFEVKRVNCRESGSEWSGEQASPVDAFPPNPWGLYDTSGNVLEWVEDCWHDSYEGAPEDASPWLESGGGDCGRRVLRGGSWYFLPGHVRSATRFSYTADCRDNYVGFRLAQHTRYSRSCGVQGHRGRGAGVHEPGSRPRKEGSAE